MQGRWEQAEKEWRECGEEWGKANWAVCLLYQGKLKEAREVLEELIEEGKSWPAVVFNLATVYELCGDGSRKLKTELAEKVAKTGVQLSVATFKV
ncbi:hypothetical protein EX30DRAFT_340730 [Ascodesmis nigricans]|uniref:TPR-like protein n=1 Tax=Ascodesmis nigricans TaxID=341454 RepID=A0A4S2MXS4_9PEZI|nr:hypothetical protein EX30DRAFT_340730 [Ascodesmis nigricans]